MARGGKNFIKRNWRAKVNYQLQSKIVRALGFAIGSLRGIALTYPSHPNINKIVDNLEKEMNEIMKELTKEEKC